MRIPWNKGLTYRLPPRPKRKGVKPWHAGKNIGNHIRKKTKWLPFVCRTCGNVGHTYPSQPRTYCSASCRSRYTCRGDRNWNWRGGVTPLRLKIRHCSRYSEWRRLVFERDKFTCQMCGRVGGPLQADHFPIAFSQILHDKAVESLEDALNCSELWDTGNGRTLCKPCHQETPTYLKGKI